MKYIKEAEEVLKYLFFESWMDDEDWNEFLKELKNEKGVTLESVSNDIEKGIQNGYSFEDQIKILKLILNKK